MPDSEVQALKEKLKYRETICARFKNSVDVLKKELRDEKIESRALARKMRSLTAKLDKEHSKSGDDSAKVKKLQGEISRMTTVILDLEMRLEEGQKVKEILIEKVVEVPAKPVVTKESAAYWKSLYFSEIKRKK